MDGFKDKLFDFIKDEAIFSISLVLAVISCFFNKPSLSYINWETILLLFAIMLVVEILKNLAVFEMLARRLLAKVNDSRTLVCFLTFTCFFSSIFIMSLDKTFIPLSSTALFIILSISDICFIFSSSVEV